MDKTKTNGMKLFFTFIIFSICLFGKAVNAQTVNQVQVQQAVPYTLADRDRAIRTEAKMDARFIALETKMDVKFESQQKQLDDLKTLFIGGGGMIVTLIIFLLGYIIWDRRTALHLTEEKISLADDKAKSADEKVRILIKSLRKFSKKHPDLAEILKSEGII